MSKPPARSVGGVRFGLSFPNFGAYAEPGSVVEIAVAAERSGWDGFFVWDHIVVADGVPVADPWILLGAVAEATDRIRLGPMVAAVPRHRPWVLARQAVTLQRLSGGRFVLGVGIGSPPEVEFGRFGEPTDARVRAEMLDEALEIVAGVWSGRPFSHRGRHFRVERTTFAPRPAARIPIWVAGTIPHRRPFRRAARFDGVVPIREDLSEMRADDVRTVTALVLEERDGLDGFEVVIGGGPRTRDELGELESCGVTWYLAGPPLEPEPVEETLGWVAAGPAAYVRD